MLERFAEAQRADGIGEPTARRRVRHARELSLKVGKLPEEVTAEDIHQLVVCKAGATQPSYRDSFRSLFRWASELGLIDTNPVAESRRMQRTKAAEAWENEIESHARYKRGLGRLPSAVDQTVRHLRRFARDCGEADPRAVSTDTIIEYLATKRWGREMRRGAKSAICGFYAWGKSTQRIKKNPAKKIPVMPAEKGVPRPAGDDDVTFAIAMADEREKLAIRLASDLGLRCAEVAGIHSSDLRDRDGKSSLHVRGKGSKVRVVPVPESLARAMRVRGPGYLFPGDFNGHISPPYLGKRVNRLLPAGVTMHMLRHRFATIAYNVERDTFTVQRLMGHASPATTQIYVEIHDETLRATVEAVHQHQGAIDRALEKARG